MLTNCSYVVRCQKTETYHMIDRCDASIATWSAAGDNFVVKNVEKFASVSPHGVLRLITELSGLFERSFVVPFFCSTECASEVF